MDNEDVRPVPVPKSILVVEDETLISDLLTVLLEDDGYDVVAVPDGQEALRSVNARNFDLILTDFMMPYTNGVEMCRIIQTDSRFAERSKIPIILMSTVDIVGEDHGCRYAGYLSKPFDIDLMLTTIRAALTAAEP